MTAELVRRLKVGPTMLFLGQDYLRTGRDSHPFLDILHGRYPTIEHGDSLNSYLEQIGSEDKSAVLAWLHRRSQKIPISESVKSISDFAWNHVYTSAIDEVWVRAFRNRWRSLHSIFTDESWPQDIRDRHRLCSTFLFGCVDKEDETSRIPREEFELDERRQIAVALLRRVPDILTPRGTLLIEGWNPKTDWLRSQDFYPVVNRLGSGQVYIFGARSESRSDPRLKRLEQAGILKFDDRSLAELLNEAASTGDIAVGDPGALLPEGRQITINGRPALIPKDIFLELERFAVILDDNLTLPPHSVSADTEYFDYLRFLEEPVKLRNWDAYARRFAFERDYFYSLLRDTENSLEHPHANRGPILLHGETGTGKTVALATLAYQVAIKVEFPTVFIERSSKNVDWRSLDRFLNWAEDCGAPASLVVWDGMRQEDEDAQLWSRLADRGRKAVVVCSAYHLPAGAPKFSIEAGRLFNPQERARFLDYLGKRAPELAARIKEKKLQIDEAFLVALYRLLPPARPSIRVGVGQEIHAAQQTIIQRINNLPDEAPGFNTLALALDAAGKLDLPQLTEDPEQSTWEATSTIRGETLSNVQKLFALVMTAGRYGCRMPIELLLATLGQPVSRQITETLKTDVLLWHEEANGDLFVTARHPLEAQVYVETLFGGRPEPEADLICEMIAALSRPHRAVGADTSLDFVLELLVLIGPNSSNVGYSSRFRGCTLQFANALTKVRKEKSVCAPRLMLQEASFYREGARRHEDTMLREDKIQLLEGAVSVLEQALERPDSSPWLRSIISEELTACLGTIISSELGHSTKARIRTLYTTATDAFRKARAAAPYNAHAIVTLGWITRPLIEKKMFGSEEEAEISADLISIFDDAQDIPMDFRQQEYYLRERGSVMELLGRAELSKDAFDRLVAIGSKAGYYLRARSLFGEMPDGPLTAGQATEIGLALNYLEENWKEVRTDQKCVSLFFNLWWRKLVGKRPLKDERQVLPFSDEQWQTCYDLLERLFQLGDTGLRPSVRFLRALAKFHIGQVDVSNQEFRELANDSTISVGGRRLRKLFVASKNGKAMEFDGQVLHDLAEHELGRLWVNQLRAPVAVVPRDFDRKQLRKNDSLTDFHIAFSFAGPIAQPQHFLRNR